jgi:hypothetical protein
LRVVNRFDEPRSPADLNKLTLLDLLVEMVVSDRKREPKDYAILPPDASPFRI